MIPKDTVALYDRVPSESQACNNTIGSRSRRFGSVSLPMAFSLNRITFTLMSASVVHPSQNRASVAKFTNIE
jgi:hypothetical protein